MTQVDFRLMCELAPRAKAGDSRAYDDLLQAAYPFVAWVIKQGRLFLPKKGDPADLEQEGMIGVFQALENWDPAKNPLFTYWAKMCVERKLINVVKGQTRVMRRAQNEASSLDAPAMRDKHGHADTQADDRLSRMELPDTSGIGVNPADVAAGDEAAELLTALCEGLTDIEQTALQVLVRGKQQAYDLDAEALGLDQNAVDNAIRRVRRKLARNAEKVAAEAQLTDETRALLRNMARLAAQPRKKVSDEELRASLPVELLRPAGLVRFARAHRHWTVPADQLLATYPDILITAPEGPKREILQAHLAGRPWAEIAAQVSLSICACKHHLRRLCEAAAKRHGVERPLVSVKTPLLQRVEQLWLKGLKIREIRETLANVATAEEVQAALNCLYTRRRTTQLREVPRTIQARRMPLVRLNKIPHLLQKAKDLLIPEYRETLKLYMQGYSQPEIAERRGVAASCIGKNDLPVIRRALKGIAGFEWLYDSTARERQIRLLALEALGITVDQAIERVTPQQREMYRLYLDGLPNKEIDRQLGQRAGAAEKNLKYCRDCVRRADDFRQHMGRHTTAERYAAKRLRSNAELHRRFVALGHLLNADQRRLLEAYFAGTSTGAIAEMFGRNDDATSRSTIWARVEHLKPVLQRLEEEQAPAALRQAAGE